MRLVLTCLAVDPSSISFTCLCCLSARESQIARAQALMDAYIRALVGADLDRRGRGLCDFMARYAAHLNGTILSSSARIASRWGGWGRRGARCFGVTTPQGATRVFDPRRSCSRACVYPPPRFREARSRGLYCRCARPRPRGKDFDRSSWSRPSRVSRCILPAGLRSSSGSTCRRRRA